MHDSINFRPSAEIYYSFVCFEKLSNPNWGLMIFYDPTKNPPAIADPPNRSSSNLAAFS
jgi:hypothetical protein